jgi:hypothetical protein
MKAENKINKCYDCGAVSPLKSLYCVKCGGGRTEYRKSFEVALMRRSLPDFIMLIRFEKAGLLRQYDMLYGAPDGSDTSDTVKRIVFKILYYCFLFFLGFLAGIAWVLRLG